MPTLRTSSLIRVSPQHRETARPQPARAVHNRWMVDPTVEAATLGRVRLRSGFSITSMRGSDGREQHLVTAPKRGPERRRARQALMAVLVRAERQHHRLSVLVTFGDYTQLRLGSSGGYDPSSTLEACRRQADDPFEWCVKEVSRREDQLARADTIIGMEIHTWPARTSQRRTSPRDGLDLS